MGITERREREREEVRKKILDAARDLFEAEGYEQGHDARGSPRRSSTRPPRSTSTSRTRTTWCGRSATRTSAGCSRRSRCCRRAAGSGRVDPPARPRLRRASRVDNPNHYRFMFMTPHQQGRGARRRRSRLALLRRAARGGDARDRGRAASRPMRPADGGAGAVDERPRRRVRARHAAARAVAARPGRARPRRRR